MAEPSLVTEFPWGGGRVEWRERDGQESLICHSECHPPPNSLRLAKSEVAYRSFLTCKPGTQIVEKNYVIQLYYSLKRKYLQSSSFFVIFLTSWYFLTLTYFGVIISISWDDD